MTRRAIALEASLAIGFYALVAVVLTWPMPRHLGSTLIGSPDSDVGASVWWLDALQGTGYHLTGTTTFPGVGGADGSEQANSLNIQWLLPSYPAYLLAKLTGEVAAYNLELLSGLVLSAAAMHLLARRLRCAPLVALWAGTVFLLFPWHTAAAEAGHVTFVHLECLPLVVLGLVLVWERRTPWRLALVAAAVLGCWLTSGLFGIMAVVVVVTAAVAAALVTTPRRPALGTAALLAGVALATSGAVYLAAQPGGGDGGIGAQREVGDLSVYGLRPAELVVPPERSSVFGDALRDYHATRQHGSNEYETANYLGLTVIAGAIAWLVVAWRRRRTLAPPVRALTVGMTASAAVALLLSTPSPVRILGHEVAWMPSRVLWEIVPAFRIPSRWVVVLLLAALVLAALAVQAGWERLRAGGHDRRLAWAAVAALLALSAVELATHPGGNRFSADAVPGEVDLLAGGSGLVAEYPFVATDLPPTSGYLFWSREHGRPLLNGGNLDGHADDVRRAVVDPGGPGVASQLAALGVRTIVTRPGTLATGVGEDVPDPASWGAGYRLLGRRGDAAVWSVVARPAPAVVTLPAGSFTGLDYRNGHPVQYLVGPRGTVEVTAPRATRATLALNVASALDRPMRVRVGRRSVVARPEGTDVRVPLSLPPGLSRVAIEVEGADAGETAVSVGAARLVPS